MTSHLQIQMSEIEIAITNGPLMVQHLTNSEGGNQGGQSPSRVWGTQG
jgi:hypothetical protein